jgi:hypothetical protein
LKKRETPSLWEVFPEGLEVQDPPLPVSGVISLLKNRCDPTPEKGLPLFLQGGDCIEETSVEAGIANFKNKKIATLKFKGGYEKQGGNEETPQRGIFLSTDGDCVICQG